MTDDPGVMGNLPRSRPGRRSEKRAGAAKAGGAKKAPASRAKKTASKAASGGAAKAKPRAARAKAGGAARASAARGRAGARPTPRAKAGAASRPSAGERAPRTSVRDERVESPQGQDPITAAFRFGMALGDAGLKVVAKVVERLPRP